MVNIALLDATASPSLRRNLSRYFELAIRLERLDAGACSLLADLALRCVQRDDEAALERVTIAAALLLPVLHSAQGARP